MKLLCPFHGDTNPSLSVDVEKGVFKCFGCGATGDTFSLASVLGLSVKEAAAAAYGEEAGSLQALWRERQSQSQSSLSSSSPRQTSPPSQKALIWLAKRGLLVTPRGELQGVSAGLLPRFGEGNGVLGISAWCAVERGGKLEWETWLYYRVMRKRASTRYFSVRGFPRGHCVGVAGTREGDAIYLSEGVFDGLTVLLAQDRRGLPKGSAYYTFGAEVSQRQAAIIKTLRNGRRLILAYDNDQAGADATLALLRLFPDALVLAYPGTDPGDALDREGEWHLVPGMEWLVERTRSREEQMG